MAIIIKAFEPNGGHWSTEVSHNSKFAYSNLGFGVLAQIIENITGQRFDLAAKNLILDKIGVDAGFNWSGISDELVSQSSPLYRRAANSADWRVQVDGNPLALPRPIHNSPNGAPLSDYIIGTNGLLLSPQGGLRANIMDLMKIAEILMGRTSVFSQTQIAMMAQQVWEKPDDLATGSEREVFQSFGSGIHRIEAENQGPIIGLKRDLIGHYGQAYGLLGGVWVDEQTSSGFAWFINGSLEEPQVGVRSSLFAIEEDMMQACAEDLGLCR
ncbi:MAG: beta-lactamase [Hyphomonadaceae bacterium]|nr:MAG: beta-lactamase [Hyphomonadaceae bacterium]